MLRTSERSTMKKCEFLWDLTYNRRIKPQTEMPALRFGSLVHRALADYYVPGVKRGQHPRIGFEKAYEADMKVNKEIFGMKVEEDERWINAAELGAAMMDNYVDEYGADDNWEVLVTEYPFRTLIYRPDTEGHHYKPPEPWFWYTGIVDGVWRKRSDKTVWIPDHKTTSGIGEKNWRHLILDDQAGAYWSWGVDALVTAGLLKNNMHLSGMLYNIMRKTLPDERASKFVGGKRVYLNKDGSASQKQPSPYFVRRPIFRDEIDRQHAKDRSEIDYARIELFRSGELSITKNPGQFTCNMCPMRDPCELHETGSDMESFLKSTTKKWDPYAEHEIYDGR